MFLDNLGCVFILGGGLVPDFAVGTKRWGEFVRGGTPNSALQSMARELLQPKLDGEFEQQADWLPRERNNRADCLSCVSEMRHHDYRILFRKLDAFWPILDRMLCFLR